MSTIRGTSIVQLNGAERKFTDAGNKSNFHYEGTQAECVLLVHSLRRLGYEVTLRYDKSPLATLDATYPDSEAPGRTGDITDTVHSTGVFTAPAHELLSGDGITVAGIVGITGATTYYVLPLDDDTFKLYSDFNLATQVYPTNDDDTGTFTKVESPQPRWELFAEEIEVPADQAIYIDKLAGAQLSSAQRKIIGKLVNGQEITGTEAGTFSAGVQIAFLNTVQFDGLRTISYSRPVITVSKTVTKGYDNSTAGTNVGCILSTAQMGTLELMPAGLLAGIVGYADPGGVLIGWRKGFPRREALGGGMFAISQKFEYDFWNSAVFIAAT